MKYRLLTSLEYSFQERLDILKDLSTKIFIQGAALQNNQYLQLRLKNGAKMWNVKSILRKHFNIEYKLVYYWNSKNDKGYLRYCKQDDIIKLCRCYLENNCDLDYTNKYDPLGEKNTVSKRVYQYGQVRYDLLSV